MRKWIAIAAALIIAAALWWFLSKPSKYEQLFTDYFRPDPGLPLATGVSQNYSFDRAMINYKTGSYQAAINGWDSLLIKEPANDTLNYFIGVSWLALKDPDKAINFLSKVVSNPGSVFLNEIYWYLGLAHLKKGNKQKAIGFVSLCIHPRKDALLSTLTE